MLHGHCLSHRGRCFFSKGRCFHRRRELFFGRKAFGAFDLLVALEIVRQFFADLVFIERTVESREEKHHRFRAHAQEEHQVTAFEVRQLEERAENHDGCAPRVGIVQKSLPRHTVHPVLQARHDIEFTRHIVANCEIYFFLSVGLPLTVAAFVRTQRKPMNERGWFWYSQVRHAERI